MSRLTSHTTVGRTAADIARGIGAGLALVAVLAGIPALLIALGANPIPSSVPSLDVIIDTITRPDDGSLFIGTLEVVAWAGWATFALPILFEIPAQLRGVRAPRLPGIGFQQRAAAGLVAAVAVLITATAPAAVANTFHTANEVTQQQPTRAELLEPAPPITTDAAASAATEEDPSAAPERQPVDTVAEPEPATPGQSETAMDDQVHVVERGDTLWDIAATSYGDPTRWPDIYDASTDTIQPDGRQLKDPDLIIPGWELSVPGLTDGQAGGEPAPPVPPVDEHDETDDDPDTAPGPDPVERPDTSNDAGLLQEELPGQDDSSHGSVSAHATAQTEHAAIPAADSDLAALIKTTAGIGMLLAGGLVTLLVRRRRLQQRRRRGGQRIPMPAPDTASLEVELRATDGVHASDTIDRILRTLAAAAAKQQSGLPRLRAGRLTHNQFELILAEPSTLPDPFVGTADQRIWTIPTDSGELLDADEAQAYPSPYPSLISIGHDEENAILLLDLEYLGLLGVRGEHETAVGVLTAIAAEYATSTWADDLQVTLVGHTTHDRLDATLRTGRLRHVTTLDEILTELEQRAAEDRAELGHDTGTDVPLARSRGTAPDTWTPEILLIAAATSTDQRDRMATLVNQLPRVAIAAVTTDPDPTVEWTIALSAHEDTHEPTGVLEPLGITIRPQQITAGEWDRLADLLRTADQDPVGEAWPEVGLDDLTHDSGTVHPDNTGWIHDQSATTEHGHRVDPSGTSAVTTDDVNNWAHTPGHLDTWPAQGSSSSTRESPVGANDDDYPHRDTSDTDRTGEQDHGPDSAPAADQGPAEAASIVPGSERQDPVAPHIRVLGPVDIIGDSLGEPEATKRGQLTRIAAFIAMHPGASPETLDAAIWPGHRKAANTRNTAISKLRRWLGKNADGQDWLPRFSHETGFAYLPGVRTDWDEWCDLLPDGPEDATTMNIRRALDLVRGRPFTGRDRLHYDYADPHAQEMICAIVDACHELATRSLTAGDAHAARPVIALGQSLEPGAELLWRDRFKVESLIGDPSMLEASAAQYRKLSEDLGGEPDDDTVALIDQILHHHRAAI